MKLETAKMRAMIKLKDMKRRVASFVLGKTGRIVEYSFALQYIGDVKNILDIGCSGSSFAFNLAKKGYYVHAIDIWEYPFRHERLNFYFADARYLPFTDDSFDVITCVSTIEHIGTGEYGNPIDEHGDLRVMMEIFRVCKTGGRVIITTSWAEKYRYIPGLERYYDDARLNKLCKGFELEVEEYYAPLGGFGIIHLIGTRFQRKQQRGHSL
jgi:SAM-dependent methyltransferase